MKILLTGFTGLVGQQLTQYFIGHECHGVSRTPRATSAFKKVWTWEEIGEAVEGMDVVIHMSGESVVGRWSEHKKSLIRSSRVESTRNLVRAMGEAKNKPVRFLCANAVGYYGERGEESLTEGSHAGVGFLAETCKAWETEALKATGIGIQTACMRIGIVLTPKGGALKQMLPAFQMGLGGALGSGKQWMPWIHVADVCAAIHHLATTTSLKSEVYNLTAPQPARQKEFANALGKVLHRPSVMKVPAFALKIAVGEFSEEVLKSVQAKPVALLEEGFTFSYPEIATALDHLCGT